MSCSDFDARKDFIKYFINLIKKLYKILTDTRILLYKI